MPAPNNPNTAAATEAAAAKKRAATEARKLAAAAELLREVGYTVTPSASGHDGHGGKRCGCNRATQHQADADAVARVRELLARWDGPEGWTDMETGRQYESGYKTAWRERASELADAMTPSELESK